MIWNRLPIAMDDADGSGGGAPTPTLTPPAPPAGDTVTMTRAELDALMADTTKLKADAKAAEDKRAADLKAKQDAAAIKAGETKDLLDQKNARIAELETFYDQRLEVDKTRVDGLNCKVKRLPIRQRFLPVKAVPFKG